jgi:cadmium resistance protein CadD (predicted permease)
MDQAFATICFAVAAFASTNLDDLLLLATLFVDAEFSARSIIIGQFIGMAVLVAVSVIAALLLVVIPDGWLALLGLAPFLLGVRRFWKLWSDREAKQVRAEKEFFGPGQLHWWSHSSAGSTVMILTIANGGDNMSVYIPMFATQRALIPVYAGIFACLTAIWCVLGYYLTHHPLLRERLKKYGRIVIPFVLVGIGSKVLTGGHLL